MLKSQGCTLPWLLAHACGVLLRAGICVEQGSHGMSPEVLTLPTYQLHGFSRLISRVGRAAVAISFIKCMLTATSENLGTEC